MHGYALDQIVLRADKLADSLHPQTIILAFIADDIDRTGLSVKDSTYKSYFVVKGDGLELRNVPVPPTRSDGPHTWPRRILGYSYLLEFVMHRIGGRELWYGAQVSTGEDAPTISCRLMARFAGSVRRHSAHALVVALPQYNDWEDAKASAADHKRTSMVLECAHRQGLQTLDTYGGFAALSKDPRLLYVDWHLNAAGNGIAARLIAAALPDTLGSPLEAIAPSGGFPSRRPCSRRSSGTRCDRRPRRCLRSRD